MMLTLKKTKLRPHNKSALPALQRCTVFPHNLEIQRSQYISVWKLFKGKNYMRKYGMWSFH